MKIVVEGESKEIAALVLELQERRVRSIDVTKAYANNLVEEHDKIGNIQIDIPAGPNGYIA